MLTKTQQWPAKREMAGAGAETTHPPPTQNRESSIVQEELLISNGKRRGKPVVYACASRKNGQGD